MINEGTTDRQRGMDNESMGDGEWMDGRAGRRRLETDGRVVDRWRDDWTSGKDFVACAGGDAGCANGVYQLK